MPQRIGLLLSDWPQEDRTAWERATTRTTFFDEHTLAAGWREKSRLQARYAYGRWLAFLTGHSPKSLAAPLAERLDINSAGAYVESLAARISPMSVAAELNHLILALSALASNTDWAWLRAEQYRWQKIAKPRDKRTKMIHGGRLLDLGLRLMARAELQDKRSEKARDYRDGLLIAILALIPLRRRTLALLKVGKHLLRVGNVYIIAVASGETKTGQPLEYPLPARLTRYVDCYLAHYRLLFRDAATHNGVWASAQGSPLDDQAIYDLVCRRTTNALGFSISPHLFRDVAVMTIARDAPDKLSTASDLLGHSSLATTDRHYRQAQTIEASRQHARSIDALRAKGRLSKSASTGNYGQDLSKTFEGRAKKAV